MLPSGTFANGGLCLFVLGTFVSVMKMVQCFFYNEIYSFYLLLKTANVGIEIGQMKILHIAEKYAISASLVLSLF